MGGVPDGSPILFIHGYAQSHLAWSAQYESALAGEFRMVAMDLRGHGDSAKPLTQTFYTDSSLWAMMSRRSLRN